MRTPAFHAASRRTSLVAALLFTLSTLSLGAPSPTAAAVCLTNKAHPGIGYKIERQFIHIDGTGNAFLRFDGTICSNGSTAWIQNGSPTSGVNNRVGLVPAISKGTFTDGGGTVHVWTDMKFTRSCGGSTFVGWVQLRLWFYANGTFSAGSYKPVNGACQTAIHWT